MASAGSGRSLYLARVENVRLQNAKLKAELARTQAKAAPYQVMLQLVPLVTALVSVLAFSWGVYQYKLEQEKNRGERAFQSSREQEVAQREFMKPWLEAQRMAYDEALTAAAMVANTSDPEAKKLALEKFQQLYEGRMILVETQSVSGAMVQMGNCFKKVSPCNREKELALVRALATAMAESMAATAKMSYQDFSNNQFKYRER